MIAKMKKPGKRCEVCRFYVPTSMTRGDCRVTAPIARSQGDRATWTPTEPHSSCGAFSRLRVLTGKQESKADLPGQTLMFATSSESKDGAK